METTHFALAGTAALCLPNLVSLTKNNNNRTPIDLFLFPETIKNRNWDPCGFSLRFAVCPFRLDSHPFSFVSYTWTHASLAHFTSNFVSLASSALFLNLGFGWTCLLMYGGSLVGACTQIGHAILKNNRSRSTFSSSDPNAPSIQQQIVDWINKTTIILINKTIGPISTNQKRFVLAGASCASYALFGAECVVLLRESTFLYTKLKKSQRMRTEKGLGRLANLLVLLMFRTVALAGDVARVLWDEPLDFGWRLSVASFEDAEIGHAGHIGAFLYGVLVGWIANCST